jgi:hypothetical protein
MNFPLVLALLILGHIIGDFYLQWSTMAKRKNDHLGWMVAHGAVYAACMLAVLLIGIEYDNNIWCIWAVTSISHFIVDLIKGTWFAKKRWVFTIDQFVHFVILGAAWSIWGKNLSVCNLVNTKIDFLPQTPILVILGLLMILRPVAELIDSGDIWDFNKADNIPNKAQKHAGRMIGYLERIIAFVLLMVGQYSAIAIIIAVKAMARGLEKGNKDSPSEYYLIGTLLSMTSVFTITLLLGLIKTAG